MDYTPANHTNTTGQPTGNMPQGNNYPPQHTPTPAEIYTATSTNAPQYHYGAPQNFFNPRYLEEQRIKMLEMQIWQDLLTNPNFIQEY